ncbi:calcineurin-like phosphoesterase [Cadophora sp. MPI-SDFR-AT-0126]|nr:calcineurin-like phosphoesterase [Leotiomycetes sp. MPI-SDFR-AT-0126]
MPDTQPTTRRTRFVCISDTHNGCPGGAFKLPKGDVLIHAGDMTNQGSFSELKKTVDWLEEADFEKKIIVAGNHDITLDSDFYSQYGPSFHNQNPQDPRRCQELLEQSPSITWLKHEAAVVNLTSPTGPRTTFKIFGSPYSPADGMWAFGYNADEAKHIWDPIPLDADIVLTHTPPINHVDQRTYGQSVGCKVLREALWRVRPRMAICGHVHEGRGAEHVLWELGDINHEKYENRVERWEDSGRNNKQISLVNLTAKGRNPLNNDGALGRRETCIINAAIAASSYPHTGGRKFNKPIVVDIDLPVWKD